MNSTALTSVRRAACGGSARSSSRAAYSPPNPPPAMTIRQAIGRRLPPVAILEYRMRGEGPGGAGHRASRVATRAGEVQPLDPAEPARAGPVLEHLPRE